MSPPVRGGFYELRIQYVETLAVPLVTEKPKLALIEKSVACQKFAADFLLGAEAFSRRIPDLCPPEREPKLSTKLQGWWKLDDFAAFRAEVKKCFKADIPLKERSDWEDLFTTGKAEIEHLSRVIKSNEDDINAIVYQLFNLTPEEIELLETSIGAR
jgi:hypothetical protein